MRYEPKQFKKVVNEHAWLNDTWLAPYYGYPVTVFKYVGGKIDILLDGSLYQNVEGAYTASNGWEYTLSKLLS